MNKTKFPLLVLFLAMLPGVLLAAGKTITVTATGFGQTVEAAEKSALQKAVRKALGELVDAETLTDKEEIIKDEVLSYSDGFVQSRKVLSGPDKDPDLGLFSVTIQAVVVRNKVVERLRAAKIAVTEVSGEDIWTELISKIQGVEDGRALLEKFLWEEMLPERLLVARLVSKGTDGRVIRGPGAKPVHKPDYDNGTVELTFHIETFYHLDDYYRKVAPRLLQLLDKICERKIEPVAVVAMESLRRATKIQSLITGYPGLVYEGYGRLSVDGARGTLDFGQWKKSFGGSRKVTENITYVACNVGRDQRGKNHRFAIYELDQAAYESILRLAPGLIIPRINLVLEDGDRAVIRHERWFPGYSAESLDGAKCEFIGSQSAEWRPFLDGLGSTRDFESAYGISISPSQGLVSFTRGSSSSSLHCTISPWFFFDSASDFITDAPVFVRKLTLDQAEVKRLKRVKLFYEGLGLPSLPEE